jgi:CP family cyanate transporter-like MFS transporter
VPTRRTVLVLVGLVLLSLNLRPAAVSVGPVLAEVRAGLGMGAASAGLLTSLPVLAFAVFGALAPALASRIGLHRVTLLALVCVIAGLGTRVLVDHEASFLALSMLALAGMAVANVVLPSLVKLHFPDRVGLVTAIYTTALSIGLTAALWLTVPISEAFGDWRDGLGAWAVIAVVAAVPWTGLIARDRHLERPERTIRYVEVLRTRLGLAMALFFGFQSLQAYVIFGWFASMWRDAGFSAAEAGLLVGLVAATAIPLSLWAPTRLAKSADPRWLLFAILACYLVGYAGILVAPRAGAVAWALLVGAATTTFPLVLTLVGLRARTTEGTAALSGVTQSVGYLIAAAGPFSFGALHDATGGWTWPLLVLTALVLPLFALAAYVARPVMVEDQLARTSPGVS